MKISFDNSYERLPKAFYEKVEPSAAQVPELIIINKELCKKLGINIDGLSHEELANYFSGKRILPGASPLSMAYSGHQFGHFAGVLGDGRAILLGEVVSPDGKRWDLHLKGAGQTPFARRGDGRSALGPVLREYLVSEYFASLGIPGTRALAATLTGETVFRRIHSPGGILARVASSHIRVGTFEYFAAQGDLANLKILADYTIKRHYPEIAKKENPYLLLLREIITRQCQLIPQWLGIGFIHGVMNTDNTAISGETLDFGPCAFMDEFKFDKVFSSIDRGGRYAYNQQPAILQWNMAVLAECLVPLIHSDTEKAVSMAKAELARMPEALEKAWLGVMGRKLGIQNPTRSDGALIQEWLEFLQVHELDFTNSFTDLSNNDLEKFNPLKGFAEFQERWQQRVELQDARLLMKQANPKLIPRNHLIEKVIDQANQGDFKMFFEMHEVLSKPFESTHSKFEKYCTPPTPEERVQETFCGT